MAPDVEIDRLAKNLLGRRDASQQITDAICSATEARQWDEVVKWNRVNWRLRMMARTQGRLSSVVRSTAAP